MARQVSLSAPRLPSALFDLPAAATSLPAATEAAQAAAAAAAETEAKGRAGRVVCFTPKGDVHYLPQGATPLDFAYSIHSSIGRESVSCKASCLPPLAPPASVAHARWRRRRRAAPLR